MSQTNQQEVDKLNELIKATEELRTDAKANNTDVSEGVCVSTEIYQVHKKITSHEYLYSKNQDLPGQWNWSGMREIKSSSGASSNPNLQLADGVSVYYGSLNYDYAMDDDEVVTHSVIPVFPVILDIKSRAPSKNVNAGTYGVDWWNVYLSTSLLGKLCADIKATTKMEVSQDGIIMDDNQGLASVTVNIRDHSQSPRIFMLTVHEEKEKDEDGNAIKRVNRENLGTLAEIMAVGGEDHLLSGVGYFTLGVSFKGHSGSQGGPPAGSLVKLSMKMKAFHAMNIIDSGIQRISYTSRSSGLDYS